jgi:hypothetical protein
MQCSSVGRYDSILNTAALGGLGRSITGSPWFAEIVRSTLPLLDGDGTIPITYKSNGLPSSNNADDARSNIAVNYLTDKFVNGNYRLHSLIMRRTPLFFVHVALLTDHLA